MLYQLKALSEREGVVSLLFDAADANAAAQQAAIQGYTVLTVKPRSAGMRGHRAADVIAVFRCCCSVASCWYC
jgi:hypothetical protein